MREICLDTETTGIEPRDGHKIIEIACFELINKVKTGKFFHSYVNPQRDVPYEAFRIHGISGEFLQDKPLFGQIVEEFLQFIGDDKLVIHNAAFDLKFLNYELQIIGKEPLDSRRAIDSLQMARKKFPGGQNSLDALCRRFGISLDNREKHGAKIDTELLCDVYLELCGGAQASFGLENATFAEKEKSKSLEQKNSEQKNLLELFNSKKTPLSSRKFSASPNEVEVHRKFILKNFKDNFWEYSE